MGPKNLSVAYYEGPEDIQFAGRQWQRGIPQPVTAEEWDDIQARDASQGFGFAKEPSAEPVKLFSSSVFDNQKEYPS